jgi:hypothetical protein
MMNIYKTLDWRSIRVLCKKGGEILKMGLWKRYDAFKILNMFTDLSYKEKITEASTRLIFWRRGFGRKQFGLFEGTIQICTSLDKELIQTLSNRVLPKYRSDCFLCTIPFMLYLLIKFFCDHVADL